MTWSYLPPAPHPTHLLELAGEPLVLLCQLGDQQTLLLLGRPLAALRLLQQRAETLQLWIGIWRLFTGYL